MGKGTADGAAVADCRRSDIDHGFGNQRTAGLHQIGIFNCELPRHWADHELSVFSPKVVEAGAAIEIDQRLRSNQPKVHQRQQTLTAGQTTRFTLIARQMVDNFFW